ncbi:MAG: hypothetical protein ABSA59_24385 [Terriglobia bacterium]
MMTRHKRLFSVLSCKRIEYTFTSSLDKFRFEEFAKDLAQRSGEAFEALGISFVAPTRNPKTVGYHVHFSGGKERRRFRATLEYVNGTEIPDAHETRPFAEELMGWIGQFFRSERITADVEATFLYPLRKFEPVLPMPMRLSLGRNQEIEVNGMSVFVSARPQGVYSAFVILLISAK